MQECQVRCGPCFTWHLILPSQYLSVSQRCTFTRELQGPPREPTDKDSILSLCESLFLNPKVDECYVHMKWYECDTKESDTLRQTWRTRSETTMDQHSHSLSLMSMLLSHIEELVADHCLFRRRDIRAPVTKPAREPHSTRS